MENFLFDAIASLAKAGVDFKAKKLIEDKRKQDLYDIEILEELLHETKRT